MSKAVMVLVLALAAVGTVYVVGRLGMGLMRDAAMGGGMVWAAAWLLTVFFLAAGTAAVLVVLRCPWSRR